MCAGSRRVRLVVVGLQGRRVWGGVWWLFWRMWRLGCHKGLGSTGRGKVPRYSCLLCCELEVYGGPWRPCRLSALLRLEDLAAFTHRPREHTPPGHSLDFMPRLVLLRLIFMELITATRNGISVDSIRESCTLRVFLGRESRSEPCARSACRLVAPIIPGFKPDDVYTSLDLINGMKKVELAWHPSDWLHANSFLRFSQRKHAA